MSTRSYTLTEKARESRRKNGRIGALARWKNHIKTTTTTKQYQRRKRKKLIKKYGIGLATIRRYGLKKALLIYDSAGRKCKKCESEFDLTIHHLDGVGRNYEDKGLKPNNNINNLIVLCRRCHGSIHGKEGSLKRWGKR